MTLFCLVQPLLNRSPSTSALPQIVDSWSYPSHPTVPPMTGGKLKIASLPSSVVCKFLHVLMIASKTIAHTTNGFDGVT